MIDSTVIELEMMKRWELYMYLCKSIHCCMFIKSRDLNWTGYHPWMEPNNMPSGIRRIPASKVNLMIIVTASASSSRSIYMQMSDAAWHGPDWIWTEAATATSDEETDSVHSTVILNI